MKNRIGWLILPDLSWLQSTVRWKTLLALAVMVAIAVGGFIAVGGVPIAANQPDSKLFHDTLHFVFKRSVAESARNLIVPADIKDESRVKLGARLFDMVCANCHGGPGIGQSVFALSMSPRPQNLPRVVDQFTDEELFVIVENGVKFSAMPSWPTSSREDEVWTMVAFLRQLPKIDAKTYLALTAPDTPPANAPTFPLGNDFKLKASDTQRNSYPVDEYLYKTPSMGFGDRTLRSHPVAVCANCHGAAGDGAATGGEAPNLTIQDAGYLRASLEAYANGSRKSGFMQEIATQLSSDQINSLANYYAALPVKTLQAAPTATPNAPEAAKLGESIALNGIPARAIVACSNCHESAGTKLTGAPHLAGQSEIFLRRQLGALKNGGRGSVRPWNPMYSEAHDLSTKEIASLASYYSGLTPVKSGGPLMKPVWPVGDAAKGETLFRTVCIKCHLNGGRGDNEGSFPDILLQTSPYLFQTLHNFRSRVRANIKMQEVASDLSDDDIVNVTTFLNSLPPEPAVARPKTAPPTSAVALAEKGAPERGIPACLSCHSASGIASLALVPRLQGQSAPYLQSRLDAFSTGDAQDYSTLNPMPAIAVKLTAQERLDLARYFSSLAPLDKTAAQ